MFRLLSFCANIYVRLFTVCFRCLLFHYFPKMLWWEWPPAHFAFRLEIIRRIKKKKRKKNKTEKSPWYQLWLYCMCKPIDSLTYLWDVFWKFYVLVCLYVGLFSFLCQSVPTHTHRRAFVPLKSCDIIWWCEVFKGNSPLNSGTQVKLKDVHHRKGNKILIYEYWFEIIPVRNVSKWGL